MWRKLLFFAALYFLQGAALAYIVNFQKPYLAGRGIGKESIGLFTSLLLLPFIFKILLGWISDRFPLGRFGRRKPYMFLGLALFGGCYFMIEKVDPGSSFAAFALLTWFASLGLAWFDTCADGWAIDVASEKEESAFQAAMVGGKALGLILMSGAFGFLGMRYGFGAIFRLLVYLTAIVAVAVFFARYTPRTQNQAEVTGLKGLRNKSFLIFALFGVVYSIASFGMDGLVTLFLSETRLISPIELGIFGMNRGAGALLGAATYVVVLRKSSSRFAQTLALTVLGVGCLIPLLPLPTGFMGTLWGFAWGFQETAFVTLAMKHSKGPWAASVFALCMIFSNVGTAIGEALGSPLVPLLGFSGVFLGFAIVAWASLALVHKLFPARN